MKKSGIAAIAVAALLVVGGGTAYALTTNAQDADGPALIEATATSTPTPDATASEAPLVAESPAPPVAANDAEAAFLIEVRARLAKIRTQIPDAADAQLIEAAHEACAALAPDKTGEDLSLIDGETRTNGHYMDSGAIIVAARMTICPIER